MTDELRPEPSATERAADGLSRDDAPQTAPGKPGLARGEGESATSARPAAHLEHDGARKIADQHSNSAVAISAAAPPSAAARAIAPTSSAALRAADLPRRPDAAGRTPDITWVFLLAGVTALGPFAMQALAPALPGFARALAISDVAAQSMISSAMLAIAIGAVVYGPLADHFGRRPVLLAGLILSVVGALVAAVAPTFELALVGRVAQAAGAGAGMVLARAAAQDVYGAQGAAAVLAKITAFMVVAPMLAPAIGGALAAWVGWRGIFVAVAVLSIAMLYVAHRRFKETARELSPRLEVGAALRDYGAVASRRAFVAHAVFASCLLASFFLFVSGGPYVLERAFGIGPLVYGVMFIGAAAVYMAANLASPALAERIGSDGVLRIGAMLGATGCVITAVMLWGPPTVAVGTGLAAEVNWAALGAVSFGLCFHAAGTGLATPGAIAGAVAAYPRRAGSAASLVSVAQFSAAALAAQAATALPFDRGAPLFLCMAALLLLGVAALAALSAPAPAEKSVDKI
ncbi:MAG: MFS transporter [Pseudomonadota bacterium]